MTVEELKKNREAAVEEFRDGLAHHTIDEVTGYAAAAACAAELLDHIAEHETKDMKMLGSPADAAAAHDRTVKVAKSLADAAILLRECAKLRLMLATPEEAKAAVLAMVRKMMGGGNEADGVANVPSVPPPAVPDPEKPAVGYVAKGYIENPV